MKNIILILLICFSSLYAEIDEYKSDVYFANGIDTTFEQAEEARNDLNISFKLSHPQTYNPIKKWDIAYNHTHGIGIDLYESLLQKIYEDEPGKSIVPFVWNIGEISDYLVGIEGQGLTFDFFTLMKTATFYSRSSSHKLPSIKLIK